MRMLDLFSGIGGFALAAEWTWQDELDIVGFCEIEKYAQKVLQKNFPGVPIHKDITKLNGKDFKNIDLITGGFPCQDISIAGKGEGITGSRSGLWTEMCRIISEVRPRYAIIENVPMLIHRGLERVLCDLTEIGYDCEWQIIGADDIGAWHRRKRIWIVAYSNTDSIRCLHRGNEKQSTKGWVNALGQSSEICEDVSNTDSTPAEYEIQTGRNLPTSLYKDVPNTIGKRSQGLVRRPQESQRSNEQIGFQSRARKRNWWNIEPNVGRVANGIPKRVDRLKGLGNAIVPQVAYEIMRRIKDNA